MLCAASLALLLHQRLAVQGFKSLKAFCMYATWPVHAACLSIHHIAAYATATHSSHNFNTTYGSQSTCVGAEPRIGLESVHA